MRLTWRNGVAYLFVALALVQYVVTAPAFLGRMASGFEVQSVTSFIAWLTSPVHFIGWAAVVEYLSRIAEALQRRGDAA